MFRKKSNGTIRRYGSERVVVAPVAPPVRRKRSMKIPLVIGAIVSAGIIGGLIGRGCNCGASPEKPALQESGAQQKGKMSPASPVERRKKSVSELPEVTGPKETDRLSGETKNLQPAEEEKPQPKPENNVGVAEPVQPVEKKPANLGTHVEIVSPSK
ncbi:MAG TPA: hypothetical protein VF857_08915 [Spirochaetota bacterium]